MPRIEVAKGETLTQAIARAKMPPSLVKVKVEGTKLVSPLKEAVDELVITSPEEYQGADELLASIRRARRAWEDKIEPILKPLREAKSAADALNREIDRPMGELEAKVKDKMADFKEHEAPELAAEQRRIDDAQANIQAQLEETSAKELAAKTKQMRDRLAQKREQLEERAEEVEQERPVETKASHSTVRHVPKWRLIENKQTPAILIILKAILAGQIPPEVIMLDNSYINKVHLIQRDMMKAWPGFELYEETIIAGR